MNTRILNYLNRLKNINVKRNKKVPLKLLLFYLVFTFSSVSCSRLKISKLNKNYHSIVLISNSENNKNSQPRSVTHGLPMKANFGGSGSGDTGFDLLLYDDPTDSSDSDSSDNDSRESDVIHSDSTDNLPVKKKVLLKEIKPIGTQTQ